jgi:5-methylthioadenosine/S-adenosylhomocysteine deaminase
MVLDMVDLLIENGLVVTMDSERRIIVDGSVAVVDDRIVEVGKTSELKKEYCSGEVVDAGRKIVMPGLVNAHCHMFAMFSRGLGADGQRSARRMEATYSWDVERLELFDREACHAAGMLAAVELIRSGVTTTQDSHYINFHGDAFDGVAQSVKDSGIRAILGRGCWDAPGLAPAELTEDVDAALGESERAISRWHGEGGGRISVRVEASMLAQCTDEMIQATKELARRNSVGWATHLQYRLATSRTDPRRDDSSQRRFNGRAVEYLNSLDVLGPESLLIHCTHVTGREIAILSRTGTPVAHCPIANAWSGNPIVTPVPAMLEKGVTIGLGTDSVATNDSLDLFQAMKFCALIHKVNQGSSTAMTAEKVLEMSTIDAAKALNLEKGVGSLEPRKKADIILLDMDSPGMVPSLNPVKNLVFGFGGGRAVDTVLVDGNMVMEGGEIRTLDEGEVYSRAEEVGRVILRKLGRLDAGSHYLKTWG